MDDRILIVNNLCENRRRRIVTVTIRFIKYSEQLNVLPVVGRGSVRDQCHVLELGDRLTAMAETKSRPQWLLAGTPCHASRHPDTRSTYWPVTAQCCSRQSHGKVEIVLLLEF